jgi:nicotinate-nucleotide adenylyltransferase
VTAPLGIFGGTFDPVHFAHLRLAEEAAETLALARVRWVPSGNPGHRRTPRTPAGHRVAMIRHAIAGNPRFELDDADAHSPAPLFTIDTLQRLRSELGSAIPFVFVIGADQLHALGTWRRWRELFLLTHFAVANRAGVTPPSPDALPGDVGEEVARRRGDAAALAASPAGRVVSFAMTPLAISASAIRERLAAGASVRYLIPPEVLAYIEANALYAGS